MKLVGMKCEIFLQRESYLVSGKRAFARAYELRDFFFPSGGCINILNASAMRGPSLESRVRF